MFFVKILVYFDVLFIVKIFFKNDLKHVDSNQFWTFEWNFWWNKLDCVRNVQ